VAEHYLVWQVLGDHSGEALEDCARTQLTQLESRPMPGRALKIFGSYPVRAVTPKP